MSIVQRKLWPHRCFLPPCRWQRPRLSDAGNRDRSTLALASCPHLLTCHSARPIRALEIFPLFRLVVHQQKAPGTPGLPFICFGQPSTGAEGFPEPIPHADLL